MMRKLWKTPREKRKRSSNRGNDIPMSYDYKVLTGAYKGSKKDKVEGVAF
jgi:hypothetical protein